MESKIMTVDSSGRVLIPKEFRTKNNITNSVSVSELNGSIIISTPNSIDSTSTAYIINEIDELRKQNVGLIRKFQEFEKIIINMQTTDRRNDKDLIAKFIGERK